MRILSILALGVIRPNLVPRS